MKNRRAGRWVVLLTVLVLAVAACGGGEPDAGASPSGTVESPSPDEESPEPATPAEEAVAALERYLEVRDEAHMAAAVDLEALNDVATGDEFLRLQAFVVESIQHPELNLQGRYGHQLSEPRRQGDGYVIEDCEDRSEVEVTQAGTKIDDPWPSLVEPIEYTLIHADGRWLVSNSNVLVDQTC